MTRNKGIDLTKSIAILCVLFIHAGSAFYAFPVASSAWNTLLAYGSLVRARRARSFSCAAVHCC